MALGLYWKGTSSLGAIFSMISGMAVWIFFEVYPLEVPALIPATATGFVVAVLASLFFPDKKFS
jgi:Na+/proline symporter